MKITLDEKACLKHKLTLEEFLMALMIREVKDHKGIVQNLTNREVLVRKKGQLYITQHWSEVIDEILCDSNGETDEKKLLKLAERMRECFPAGKMPGTPYYYKCNNNEVIRKLKKFFIQHGDKYTDDQIVDATKRFVASFNGNYRYLPLIKYFISKLKPVEEEDGTVHNVEFSSLADFLENKEEEGEVVTNSDEWLMNAKN